MNLKHLKDVFWEVRAKWYLLGIQLDVEHSNLEVSWRIYIKNLILSAQNCLHLICVL